MSKKKEFKVGDVVKVLEINKIEGLRKNSKKHVNEYSEVYSCSINNDSIVSEMLPVFGTIAVIVGVDDSVYNTVRKTVYFIKTKFHGEQDYVYFSNWLTPLDTKAAKLLFIEDMK